MGVKIPASRLVGPRLIGIACMVAAASVFATMDALVKWLVATYPVIQVMAFRSAFALVVVLPLLWAGGWGQLVTRRKWAHLLRSVIGLVAVACFFQALDDLPLAQVTGIFFAAPLMMTALSVPLLKERVGPRRWAAVAVGFLGVLLIVRPDRALLNGGMAAALAGTVLYAVVMVLIRDMSRTEKTVTIVFWFSASSALVSGALAPFYWVPPSGWDFALLAAVGLLGGAGQLLATQAVRLAPVSVVAPFDYLHLVFATGYGWALWHDWPSVSTLAGSAVIMVCGLYVLHREAQGRGD
ncbi:MAG: DMT family transporter [Rhodospirillaceae bacterium]|nr:DMT family transporter [Rhodospirillales bacterium]